MSETAGAASFSKLGFAKGQVIQEFGYDDDVDDDLRFGLEDVIGTELEDEDFNDGADGVLLWYRDGDDDLVDLMVDGLTKLFDQGFIVLLTPKAGRAGPRRCERRRGGRLDGGPDDRWAGQRRRRVGGDAPHAAQGAAPLTDAACVRARPFCACARVRPAAVEGGARTEVVVPHLPP